MSPAQSAWTVNSDLRELVERLPLPAALNAFDDATSIVLLNEPFVRLFGYTLDDIPTVGDWAVRAYPDEAYRRETFITWNAAVAKARADAGRVESMEFRVTCRDGTLRDVLFGAAVTGDHLMVTFIDVSERRQVEAATQKLRERLERIAYDLTSRIPVGTYIIAHGDGGAASFTFVSERWLQMLDLGRDAVLADPTLAFQAVHPDDQEAFVRLSDAAMADRRAFAWEGRILVRNEPRWVSIESKPRQRPAGGLIWEGVMIDITPRKQAEAALAEAHEAERMREQALRRRLEDKLHTSLAAAATAHQITQPLGRMLLETQLAIERLRHASPDEDDLSDYLGNMLVESKLVVEMIGQMQAMLRTVQTEHAPDTRSSRRSGAHGSGGQ